MASLSVIVPTCGRDSLAATVAGVAFQLNRRAGDELIVVADSCQPASRDLARLFHARYSELTSPASRFGNAQRDLGMQLATGSHLLFIDDDDLHEPAALAVVRAAVSREPEAAHIFKARWGQGHPAHGVVLWRDAVVREQNVATPMVCLPNRRYYTSWMEHNAAGVVSDYGFLSGAIGECPRVRWHHTVIATVRP